MESTKSNIEPPSDYIVTARKWRPTRFADVVGQEHVTQTLRNAVQSGRLHHAYIFNGPRGVGKTTTARILAKVLNCRNLQPDSEPCNECDSCREISSGRSMDVIEIDGASNNSVDDIRKLRENAKYPPSGGKYKMYIIDEVHMLSTSAFNALLKTLEEPPRHLIFVFATTEPHKVPATILSRCQRFDFRRMQIQDIVEHLSYIASKENIEIDEESLAIIAKKGDGSMRDSQSIFDQVVSFCGMTIKYERVNEALNLIDQDFFFTISKAIYQHDIPTILEISRQVFLRGYDLQECLSGLTEHFRNLLTVLATGNTKLIATSKAYWDRYEKEAAHFTQADVLQMMSLLVATEQALKYSVQPRIRFEFALIQMSKMDTAVEISALLGELAELKKKLESGTIVEKKIISQPIIKDESAEYSATLRTKSKISATEISPLPAYNQENQTKTSVNHAETDNFPAVSSQPEIVIQEKPDKPSMPDNRQKISTSGKELEANWHKFTRQTELDLSLKKLLSGSLLTPEFDDGVVILHAMNTIVGDSALDKKDILVAALREYFGSEINVLVRGVSERNSSLSIFEEFLPGARQKTSANNGNISTQKSQENSTFQNIGQEESSKTQMGNSDNANEQISSQQIVEKNDELHPLDKAIIEIFKAVEVAIR